MTTENTHPLLLEIVAPNQLPEKLGGTAKNKEEGQFWPPSLPDMDFGAEGYEKRDQAPPDEAVPGLSTVEGDEPDFKDFE